MKTNEIKSARIRLGISAHEMAEALGICDDAYYRRERGAVKFKLNDIPIVADKLQLSPAQVSDFLFDGELPIGDAKTV